MYIDDKGNKWFKGNLHLHTTRSDGEKSVEEACRLYKENGYDFLCISDHWLHQGGGEYEGMLILPGCEYDVGSSAKEGIYHIVSVGAESEPAISEKSSAQEIIDAIHLAGGIAALAHPAWSLNTPEMIKGLKNIDMSEIFNSVSDLPYNVRPDSSLIFDMLATEGYFLKISAADDTHFYEECDSCRSFIYVKAESLSRESILEAIKRGDFYATQGPRIEAEYKNGEILVNTTPAEAVLFYTDKVWTEGRSVMGRGITFASYMVDPADGFVRVEVVDKAGKRAWSQYIKLK